MLVMLGLVELDFPVHLFAQKHLFQQHRSTAPYWSVVQLLKTQYLSPYLFDLYIGQLQSSRLWVVLYRRQLHSQLCLASWRK